MSEEYKVEIVDPYWANLIKQLVDAGYPKTVVEDAIRKTDVERSAKIAYA